MFTEHDEQVKLICILVFLKCYNRMTKNPNHGFLYWGLRNRVGGGRAVRAEVQGKVGVGGEVKLVTVISDTLYYPYTHCYKFSSRYSIWLPCYGLHKKSFRNLSKGHNSKNI